MTRLFMYAAWDPPSWSGDPQGVGETGVIADVDFIDNPCVQAFPFFADHPHLQGRYCEGGRLFGANAGNNGLGFAICTRCGYDEHERKRGERANLPHGFESHPPLWRRTMTHPCWKSNDAPVLRNHALGAETDTDVLEIAIETAMTSFHNGLRSEQLAYTLGHAYRRAGAALLEVDPREISSRTAPTSSGWGIHLVDSGAGGSGHIRSLLEDTMSRQAATQLLLSGDERHALAAARQVYFAFSTHK